MHHASAAGSCTPTPAKGSDSSRCPTSSHSPAHSRQALAEVNLNQPSEGIQTVLKSTQIAWLEHQSMEPKGHQGERQEERLYTVPVLQQQGVVKRRDGSSKQNKQLWRADIARQLDVQLLQSSQQAATSSRLSGSCGNAVPNTADPKCQQQTCSDRVSGQGGCGAAIMHQDHSMHPEELQLLAQMLTPTVQPQQPDARAYPMTAQNNTLGQGGKAPQSYCPHYDAGIAASRSSAASHISGYRQHALRRLGHMQCSHTAPGDFSANPGASTCHYAMQQPSIAHDCSLAMTGSMHHQPALYDVEESDLPAGIPLTPIPMQQTQPRDSLEASIWKLFKDRRQQAEMFPS